MLKLNGRKPKETFWETQESSQYKGGKHLAVCFAATPHNCLVKWKGTRRHFALPWRYILQKAVEAEVAEARRSKNVRRSGSRVSRGKL